MSLMPHISKAASGAARDEKSSDRLAVGGQSGSFPAERSKPPLNCGGALPLRGIVDRLYLYARELKLDPAASLEICAEALKRAESKGAPTIEAALEELRLLAGKGGQAAASAEIGVGSPPLKRQSMTSEAMDISVAGMLARLATGGFKALGARLFPAGGQKNPSRDKENIWEKTAWRRRLILLALVVIPSLLAAQVMYALLPAQGLLGLNLLVAILFAVLFCWISIGFWSSAAGLMLLLRRFDRFKITVGTARGLSSLFPAEAFQPPLNCGGALPLRGAESPDKLPDDFRTALLFPVYNEDMAKVSEGIRATIVSLKKTGQDKHFDTFILSDTTDPDIWAAEEEAWHKLCREENLFGRLFYRRRKSNLKRKSGNIADFCRRWGVDYKYMVVFDADSIMSGETITRLVKAMEAHPEAGIVQSAPKVVLGRSLLARIQQFANHLYGPIFAAGLHYWQLGDAQYWGHNAIIRVAPFVKHCQLPKLPGRAPLGGEILSHDFVESALMRRAGYGVWLAYELADGSYEQSPPNLIDELARDRRWCQGNLQHSRLIFTKGFFPTHRALFINGIMSYGSALLWFFFLMASSFQALSMLFITPDYFPDGRLTLFPDWPRYFPAWALTLLSGTAILLFLPKLLAVIMVAAKGGAAAFGGPARLLASVAAEVLVSTFLAPVRMIFHSYFVVSTLLGFKVGWNAQNRDDSGARWSEALRCHWWVTLFGLGWGALMFFFSPGFFIWLSPVIAGLALAVPLTVWTSRVSLGLAAGKAGLFLSPVETSPPEELLTYVERVENKQNAVRGLSGLFPAEAFQPPLNCGGALPLRGEDDAWPGGNITGFAKVVVNPETLALHLSLAGNKRRRPPQRDQRLAELADKALNEGPGHLSRLEKLMLLNAPDVLTELHQKVWALDKGRAKLWGL